MTALERAAREIYAAALAACDPAAALGARVTARSGEIEVAGTVVRFAEHDDVRVLALGKAADSMLAAFSSSLDAAGVPAAARRGLAVAHEPGRSPVDWAVRMTGGHPVPDAQSLEAGRAALDLFAGCTTRTLAVFLLSGGGSALLEWPLDGRLGADDVAALNDALVRSDLPIRSINAVRKRLSAIKGGRLAAHAAPALQLTLVVSDVPPGDVASVASGPTVADDTTSKEVADAVARAGLDGRFDGPLGEAVARAAEVPPLDADALAGVRSIVEVVLDGESPLRAAEHAARAHAALVVSLGGADGPLAAVVDEHLAALERLVSEAPAGDVVAVVSTGEVTLEVTGDGKGGRNQHSVLHAMLRARTLCPSAGELVALSSGTDGRDGPTDAAGAVAGLETLARAEARGLSAHDHLARFDAWSFFEPLGALVRTGATGTNVRDVRVFLARGRASGE
jgi:glycerate 2-kinase